MAIGLRNVPEVNRLARLMGDASSLVNDPTQRVVNRAVGRSAGKLFGFANANFGVFGMIATAQFFLVLKEVINLQTAQAAGAVHVGSAAKYAMLYHEGSTSAPARPFLEMALKQTPFRVSNKRGRLARIYSVRSGVYEGQKFIDDFAGFWRGDLMGRMSRREAGRQIAGFFWGSLRLGAETKRPNILENWLERVALQARKNVKLMGEDTGSLRASITTGYDDDDLSNKSREKMISHMQRIGIVDEIPFRVEHGAIPRTNKPWATQDIR